jgi:carbon-monoxide dehydrogenase large subunit
MTMQAAKHSRLEDLRFITGQGRYTADVDLPNQAHASFLRSDRAHAVIRSIDIEQARAMPGVIAILTGADAQAAGLKPLPVVMPFKGVGGTEILRPVRLALAQDKVRFVGEPVAIVIAESAAEAEDAAEQIMVDYDELRAVTTLAAAVAPEAPRLFDAIPANTIFNYEIGDAARVDAAFASAATTARINLHNTRVVASPMEPRACLADYDNATDAYTFYSVTQGVAALRGQLAACLDISDDRIMVAAWDVGGGFGIRFNVYPEYVALLLAAKTVGRPVKWVSTRAEAFLADEHSRGVDSMGEVALDANGKFLAMRFHFSVDLGAYCSPPGGFINTLGIVNQLTNVYDLPAVYAGVRLVLTNTSPTSAYRGSGRPIMSYAIERLVDEAARKAGIDRVDIRRRNLVPTDKFPYLTAHGKTWDCGDFAGLLEHALEGSDWEGYAARKAVSARSGKVRGRGLACFIEESGSGFVPTDETQLKFGSKNELTLYAVSHNHGQGHETVFAQIIAKVLGVPEQMIKLRNGAPEQPRLVGNATAGSRTLAGMGSVMQRAAFEVVEKGRRLAADRLEASEADMDFAEGTYRVKGTDSTVSLLELVELHQGETPHPLDVRTGMKIGATYPNGCHVVEVEIDPQTGVTEVVKYTATDDVGNIINQQLVEGQIHGGVVQGVGQILGEHAIYDHETGQPLTGSFQDYPMPRAGVVRDLRTQSHPVPTITNPLGVKGAGEAGNTGALPAVMSAIIDALGELGVRHFEMPATPARVWGAIKAAKAGNDSAFAPAQG